LTEELPPGINRIRKRREDLVSEALPELPNDYYVERDPDVLVLRRVDGSLVAAFSSRGAALEAIRRAAKEAGYGEAFVGSSEAPSLVPSFAESGLRVNFFGSFELLWDGEVVSLERNVKAIAILKYLLAHRARPIPQDFLMGWLWPESDLKRARWSLNSAVYALRKFLGGCLPSLPAAETVLFEGGRYRLSPHIGLSVDTDEFDSRCEKGRHLEKAGRMLEAVAEYERALELYRDDYMIEDLYEEWTMIERQRLVDAYTDLLRRLAINCMETGQPRESVRTCYRILEKDRCDEEAHRLLMECFVRLGQRARALRQYMTPSPRTRALYTNILKDVPR
jgi:DNA-binding SARP family transcriptional activator